MKRRYLIDIVLSFLLRILLYLTCHLSRSSRFACDVYDWYLYWCSECYSCY